jgi:hypothetical protein
MRTGLNATSFFTANAIQVMWRRPEVEALLTDLAVSRKVSASTQNQAKSAILFLYREVLQKELGPCLQLP